MKKKRQKENNFQKPVAGDMIMWPNIRVHENHTSQPNIASSTKKVKLLYCICITSKRKCVVTQDGAGHIDIEIKKLEWNCIHLTI